MMPEKMELVLRGGRPPLTREELRFFQSSARRMRFLTNKIVFRQGDPREDFYWVDEGNIRIFYNSETGRKITFGNCGPGDLFGLADLAPNSMHSANAQATEPSIVWSIPVDAISEVARRLPSFMLRIVSAMSLRLNSIAVLMESLVTVPLRIRVANFILTTAKSCPPEETSALSSGLTHEAMADILGCSRQTLTKILNEFARAGFIRIERKRINILDASGLQHLRRSIAIEDF